MYICIIYLSFSCLILLYLYIFFNFFFCKQSVLQCLHNFHMLACSPICNYCYSYHHLNFIIALLNVKKSHHGTMYSFGMIFITMLWMEWKSHQALILLWNMEGKLLFLGLQLRWFWTMLVFECWLWNQHKYIHISI